MTAQQIKLRDKLKQGSELFRSAESLRCYIRENEKIQEGAHDPALQQLIADQNAELENKYKKLIEVRSKIDRCINTISNEELRALMIMRYLAHDNTFQIAEKMYYSRNSINRKHKAALDAILEHHGERFLDY